MQVIGFKEAAEMVGKTPAALRNSYKRWNIPHFRIGGQVKFTRESLTEWIEKSMTSGEKPAQSDEKP